MKKLIPLIFLFALPALYPSNCSGQGIKITYGGHLVVRSANIQISGNLVNDGTFSDTSGTLILSGTTQDLGGNSTSLMNNLVISSGSYTTTSGANRELAGVLTCDGTLVSNGNLTFLSDSHRTALINGAGYGEVMGMVTMQRRLNSGLGYRYFSSPFLLATISEFADEVLPQSGLPSFYRYFENSDTTWWIDYSDGSNILFPATGYAINFGNDPAPKTVSISGIVTNGYVETTLFNHDRIHTKGFNLVGNPYPSPIDWDAPWGWTRSNIDNAVYYFNPGNDNEYTGSYSAYINGISSDGIAGNIIPAMQGFFVHVTDGSYPQAGTLGFSNGVRVNTPDPAFHKPQNNDDFLIRISAGFEDDATNQDPAVLLFNDYASADFNPSQDAIKLMNTNPLVPSFYIRQGEQKNYAIKAMPEPTDTMTIVPLGLTLKQSGNVVFTVKTIEHPELFPHVYFSDNRNSAVVALNENTTYQVFLDEGDYSGRFSIIFSDKELETSNGSGSGLMAFYHDGKITVYLDLPVGETGEILLSDITGRVILRESASGIGYQSYDVNATNGIYIVSLRTGNRFASRKLIIHK
jgi:hypothetical protein